MRRFLAALLAIALCAICCAPAFAADRISARTSLAGSNQARITNVEIAASQISGWIVYSGEQFSFNDVVGPRTRAYGYQSARNGRGVKVTGGGVAQVASTLYLALKDLGDQISIDEKKTYGSKFTENYVSDSNDAILVDASSDIDFAFTNLGADLLIEMWTTDNYLYCALTPVSGEGAAEEDSFLTWNASAEFSAARRPVASASISLEGSDALKNNVILAASSINDTMLSSGDLFSFNDSVGPRSERYGYELALNGRGAKVVGGGVAQVASVIWLAVKNLDCVAIVEKSTYGSRYNQEYVSSSNDAILTDYANETDFSFSNSGEEPLTISTYVSNDVLYCEIYQG